MSQDKQKRGPDSEHHGLTVVNSSDPWQAPLGITWSPILSF